MSKPVFEDVFAASGRRNRKSYVLFALAWTLVLAVVWLLAVIMDGDDAGLGYAMAGLLTFAGAIASWMVGAQRCRDFGWTGWAVLLVLVPLLGWIFAIAMLFIPGTDGANRYGPDPLKAAAADPSVALPG